jgi:hypothetical protein
LISFSAQRRLPVCLCRLVLQISERRARLPAPFFLCARVRWPIHFTSTAAFQVRSLGLSPCVVSQGFRFSSFAAREQFSPCRCFLVFDSFFIAS